MSVQPPNKTIQQDKDIVVTSEMVTGDTEVREQASVVLKNFDNAIQQEIADRIADVNAEEERALLAEAYLAKLIEEERNARLADNGQLPPDEEDPIDVEALARQSSDVKIIQAIEADREPLSIGSSTQSPKGVFVAKAWENRLNPTTGNPLGQIVIPNGDSVATFAGAHINFSTGTINSTPSFTPAGFFGYEGMYGRYLIILLPNNTLEVKVPTEFHSQALQAPYPSLATNGILVGSVVVKDDGQGGIGTITDIDLLTTTFFKDSMGSAGSSAPVINTSALEIQNDEPFAFYTKSDFQEDKGILVESTTGQNSISNNSEIVLNVGQNLISKDLIGDLAHQDSLFLNGAQAKILYKPGFFDKNATIQFSNDGGNTWKTASKSIPGGTDPNDYKGNLLIADATFSVSTNPYLESEIANSQLASGSKIAAIIANTHGMLASGFSMVIRTTSTAGTVRGYLCEVISGTPQNAIRSSAEIYSCGADINSVVMEKRFTFDSFFLEKDKAYAIVLEGTGLNGAIEVNKTTPETFNLSSAVVTSGGWILSADAVACKIYGSGYELLLKVESGTANSKVAGFGVNYVADTSFMLRGDASWEDRTITSAEAATGSVVLSQVRYVPGIRQLHANIAGLDYFAPDFMEISAGEVKFPENFLLEGQIVRFYNTYGLIENKTITSGGGEGGGGGSIQTGTELPVASEVFRGTLFLVLGPAQTPDVLYICTKDYADAYAWNELVLITQ